MNESDNDQSRSKSQVKRDMHALVDLGKHLAELPESLLRKCPLPENISEAIDLYRTITSNGARKRQLQYIGKLLREVDTAPIEAVLNLARQQSRIEQHQFHQLEQLRDSLLTGDDTVLENLIRSSPSVDIQHLRQLLRQARKEAEDSKPPAASRKLFQYLRELSKAE